MCEYSKAWIGKCENEGDESGFCEEHKDIKCCSCGDKATYECCETMGLVCGAPLCDKCEHTVQSNGCNSGGELPEGLKAHCKIDEQVYKPWYQKEIEEDKTRKVIYTKQDNPVGFDSFYSGDDHILYIKKAGYNDIDLYYVIMEDAYRTPTADVMTAEQIKEKYNLNIKE